MTRWFRLALAGALIGSVLPAMAPPACADERPALRLVPYVEGERRPLVDAQFMPGMPGMMLPMQETPGAMGGGMAMIMTGETLVEMMAGACTAGLFVGGAAAAIATAPAAPISAPLVLSSAAVGCGFAMAATAAGMAGMAGWRAVYTRLLK